MGWITNRRNKNGFGIGHGSETGRRAGVLRKIVGEMKVNDTWYEELECGHKGRPCAIVGTGGLFGVQPADSRRCLECRKQQTPTIMG